ncbi:MAG: ABC transporter permease [Gammaproteobacteria bacterium]|nr:ABC transporter permease [Gammaproteobacteria bacterium]
MNIRAATKSILPDFRHAFGQLTHHKLRSALTLLGMVFGVAAVIAMLAVSEGGRREALLLVEGMGVNNLIVEANEGRGDELREVRSLSDGLTTGDAFAIKETLPFVEAWAGVRRINVWNLISHEGQSNADVLAVSPSYFSLSGLEPAQGSLFNTSDDSHFAQKAVLGDAASRQLFPNGEAIGKRIKINYLWVEVIGVLRDTQIQGEEFQGEQVGGESERAYIPLQTGLKRLRLSPLASELSSLKLKIGTSVSPGEAARAVEHLLNQRHGGQEDTRIVVPARLLAQQRQTQRIFTIVMSAVAGISLLVGGIGIMNIMLASVLERKSEIGLLRAVGATQMDVVRQFLVETAVIAFMGALAGVVLGIAIAYVIAAFAGWSVAWSIPTIALAVGVCVSIAVGFGVYPSLSAARLDPVEALQSE